MTDFIPIQTNSLPEACILQLERMILAGELRVGERLPSERELAAKLGVSRPVLHQALVNLEAKGMVEIRPRKGVFVSNYRENGSLNMLTSLLTFEDGQLPEDFSESLLAFRKLLEVETAIHATRNRTDEHLAHFERILAEEQDVANCSPEALTDLDFRFHLQVAAASGNIIYPLIINSFKSVYTGITSLFFQQYCDTPIVSEVYTYHHRLVEAIAARNEGEAASLMTAMLEHGARYLKGAQE